MAASTPPSTRKQRVEPRLPLRLVDDFEADHPVAHGGDELRPVGLARVLRAEVEDRALVLGVLGAPEVHALRLDDEDAVVLVADARLVRPERQDEVGVDAAGLPALHVVVAARAVPVPEEQAGLSVEIGGDLVLQASAPPRPADAASCTDDRTVVRQFSG